MAQGARGGEVTRGGEDAGGSKVTAHGMRKLHSTLAVENGVSDHVVAASLGHESSTTTIQSYVNGAVAGAQQRRVMTVLEGGRLASRKSIAYKPKRFFRIRERQQF